MKTTLTAIAFFSIIFAASGTHADSTSVPELDRYKAIYKQQLTKLANKTKYQRLHIPQYHIKELRKLEAEYQASGDLRSLLAVRTERERFIGDPRIDHIEPVEYPAKLRELQISYIKNYRIIKAKRKQNAENMRNKYTQALQRLQKKLTQQGKIDQALAVMKEIESIQEQDTSLNSSPSELADTADHSDFSCFNESHTGSDDRDNNNPPEPALKQYFQQDPL